MSVNNSMEQLTLPNIPELSGGYLIIQKEAWKTLTDYIGAQTSTINALIETVDSLAKLQDVRAEATAKQIHKLASEVATIAQALEGAYVDE